MLRISKKADYAVFLLGAIARQGAYPGGSAGDGVVSAQEIARQAGLNKSVVANLLKEFAKHRLLESTRGLKGGYRLGRPPAEISLGDILEVVEGRFVLVDCVAHGDAQPGDAQPGDAQHGNSGHGNAGHGNAGHGNAGHGNAGHRAAPAGVGLLALAPSMLRGAVAEPTTKAVAGGPHDCALISFCPSKQPMRIVHERISQLFRDIHLDELCAMAPTPLTATSLKSPR